VGRADSSAGSVGQLVLRRDVRREKCIDAEQAKV